LRVVGRLAPLDPKWECKYHVAFIPKHRRKVMYGWIRQELGPIMWELAQ